MLGRRGRLDEATGPCEVLQERVDRSCPLVCGPWGVGRLDSSRRPTGCVRTGLRCVANHKSNALALPRARGFGSARDPRGSIGV